MGEETVAPLDAIGRNMQTPLKNSRWPRHACALSCLSVSLHALDLQPILPNTFLAHTATRLASASCPCFSPTTSAHHPFCHTSQVGRAGADATTTQAGRSSRTARADGAGGRIKTSRSIAGIEQQNIYLRSRLRRHSPTPQPPPCTHLASSLSTSSPLLLPHTIAPASLPARSPAARTILLLVCMPSTTCLCCDGGQLLPNRARRCARVRMALRSA